MIGHVEGNTQKTELQQYISYQFVELTVKYNIILYIYILYITWQYVLQHQVATENLQKSVKGCHMVH